MPPSSPDPDWPLLERVLAGAATPADQARLDQWLAEDPDRQGWLASLRVIRAYSPILPPEKQAAWQAMDTDAAWVGLRDRVASGSQVTPAASVMRSSGRQPHAWPLGMGVGGRLVGRFWHLAFATTVFAAVGAAVVWRFGAMTATRRAREFATPAGTRATVTLRDGTRFTLAPESRLTVADDYGRDRRDVTLDGEALFDVRHDARHVFAVHIRNAVLEDVGTRFDVRAYAEDARVRVVVADGAVALRGTAAHARNEGRAVTAPIVVPAGSLSEIDATGEATLVTAVATDPYLAWTRGELSLVHTPVAVAAAELSREFGVRVSVGDRVLGARRITGNYGRVSFDEAVHALAATVGAQIKSSRSGVTLVPVGEQP